jgi:hypothetical protein
VQESRAFPCQIFPDVHQRPYDSVLPIVRHEVRTHSLYRSVEKQVEEKGFHKVIRMMSQRDFVPLLFGCECVEHPAAQARAKRTWVGAWSKLLVHKLNDVPLNDPMCYAIPEQTLTKGTAIEFRLAGVYGDSGQLVLYGGLALEVSEGV